MPLTASPTDQARLLDLQELDTSIVRVRAQLANPAEAKDIAELDTQLSTLDHETLDRLGAVDDVAVRLRQVAADVEVVTQRTARDSERLQSATDDKVARNLQRELDTLAARREKLEAQQLELMEEQEAADAALAGARERADALRARREKLTQVLDRSTATLEAELADLESRRREQAATLPGDLHALYEKQRERYGIGASLLRGRVSVAAGVELTATELAEVTKAGKDAVVLCPASSAILVRTADSGL